MLIYISLLYPYSIWKKAGGVGGGRDSVSYLSSVAVNYKWIKGITQNLDIIVRSVLLSSQLMQCSEFSLTIY
jgi:hypothetical protein